MRYLFTFIPFFLSLALAAGEFDWGKAKSILPGIKWIKMKLEEPRTMRINIVQVDLASGRFSFTVTDRDPKWGEKMPDDPDGKYVIRTLREKTVDFMENARKKGVRMVLAVNATGWGPWKFPYNHTYADTPGLHMANGRVVSTRGTTPRPVFYIDKKGVPHIVKQVPETKYRHILHAVSGFGYVLREGKVLAKKPSGEKKIYLAPRTSYGLSRDKRYFYILTVDGRQPLWSMGADMYDLGNMMLKAGAYTALNMDGGGSTSLVYWDEKEKEAVFVNQQRLGIHRKVGSNLGIILK